MVNIILIYFRMGSFSSAPKILNGDNQDSDIHIPEGISRQELLQYCQKQHLHPMVKRAFTKANDSQDNHLINAFKFRKLNTVSKGKFISILSCIIVQPISYIFNFYSIPYYSFVFITFRQQC